MKKNFLKKPKNRVVSTIRENETEFLFAEMFSNKNKVELTMLNTKKENPDTWQQRII